MVTSAAAGQQNAPNTNLYIWRQTPHVYNNYQKSGFIKLLAVLVYRRITKIAKSDY
jgi:hypothetical protein